MLTLYLHQAKVFKRALKVKPTVSHLMKQKDLFEYGTLQLAVGAVASYLEGYALIVAGLVALVLVWIVVPYLTITFFQRNRLGWVKYNELCFAYIIMMLAISIGGRYVEAVSTSDPFSLVIIVVPAVIFLGELIKE